VIRQILAAKLEKRTSHTITNPAVLRASLESLSRAESAQGQSEGSDGVGAAATLIRGSQDQLLGALVAVYIHTGKTAAQLTAFSLAVEQAAQEISSWQVSLSPTR
jgi:DNA-binding IclR family transcriptional regulator